MIDIAEDREKFKAILKKLNLTQPENGTATSVAEAKEVANIIGYPSWCALPTCLGGRAMEIVYAEGDLESFTEKAHEASPDHPILIDKFLEDAIEIDVDAVADGERCVVAGIMEHIEEAGIHSGDSACALPPYSLNDDIIEKIKIEHLRACEGTARRGLDEHPVCCEERYCLRAGGEPAGEQDRSLCQQGHRRPVGKGCSEADGGQDARGTGHRSGR